jgi:hypothetical protein
MFDAEDPASVDVIPGEWRKGPSGESWIDFSPSCSNNFNNEAKSISVISLMKEPFRGNGDNVALTKWQSTEVYT